MWRSLSVCLFLGLSVSSFCAEMGVTRRAKVLVENRVLACVRDQTITVMDVMKKLDMIFYQQYPQYRGIPEARYEFYSANWRKALDELVDRRLALLYSEEKQLHLTNGDIRQELEDIYGPNVLMSLYEEGLSLQESYEMMREDIQFRRVVFFFVQSPIQTSLTPHIVHEAYNRKVAELQRQKGWLWRSITLKGKTAPLEKAKALEIHKDLAEKKISLKAFMEHIPEDLDVVVSQQFRSFQHEVAPSVASLLQELPLHSYSSPIPVTKGESVEGWRIYIVDEYFLPKIPLFYEIEGEIKNDLASPEIHRKTDEFFQGLRKQYHAKYLLSEKEMLALEPFMLKQKELVAHASLPTQ
jgi:hypothetical protein